MVFLCTVSNMHLKNEPSTGPKANMKHLEFQSNSSFRILNSILIGKNRISKGNTWNSSTIPTHQPPTKFVRSSNRKGHVNLTWKKTQLKESRCATCSCSFTHCWWYKTWNNFIVGHCYHSFKEWLFKQTNKQTNKQTLFMNISIPIFPATFQLFLRIPRLHQNDLNEFRRPKTEANRSP